MILNFWPFASPLGATIAIGAASTRAEDCAITTADSTAKRTRGYRAHAHTKLFMSKSPWRDRTRSEKRTKNRARSVRSRGAASGRGVTPRSRGSAHATTYLQLPCQSFQKGRNGHGANEPGRNPSGEGMAVSVRWSDSPHPLPPKWSDSLHEPGPCEAPIADAIGLPDIEPRARRGGCTAGYQPAATRKRHAVRHRARPAGGGFRRLQAPAA